MTKIKDLPEKFSDMTLNCDAINESPRDMDWSEGYGERWEYCAASECEGEDNGKRCGAIVYNMNECEKCGQEAYNEGPIMNSFYPLPSFRMSQEEAAEAIKDLPLAVVTLTDTDEMGLALTGGGMDLSWEIAEAHIRLGYWPPLQFCRLPAYAGKRLNKRERMVLDACRESVLISSRWALGALDQLNETARTMRRNAKGAR